MSKLHPLTEFLMEGGEYAKEFLDDLRTEFMPKGTLPYKTRPLSEQEQWAKHGPMWMSETPDDKLMRLAQQGPDEYEKFEQQMHKLRMKYGAGE